MSCIRRASCFLLFSTRRDTGLAPCCPPLSLLHQRVFVAHPLSRTPHWGLARDKRQQSAGPRGPPNVIKRPMGHSCEVCQKLKGNTGHRDFPEATYPCFNVACLCGNQKKTEYVLVLIDRKNFHGLHQGCGVPRTAPGDMWGIREAP